MIGITGSGSTIVKEYLREYFDGLGIKEGRIDSLPFDCDTYLLCGGILHGESAGEIRYIDAIETLEVNYFSVIRFCDQLFHNNTKAKVCIIGSESGFKGSYDQVYAGSKAALHLYVETKKLLHAEQQLVCVAPGIIEDSGMTQRRDDLSEILLKGTKRRLRRLLKAAEIAKIANFALTTPAVCNTVIRATGGNW